MNSKYGFSVGDRVVMTAECDPEHGVLCGQTGTVCDISLMKNEINIGVRWDEHSYRYHTCKESCDNHYGWYVPYNTICHHKDDIGEIEKSDCPISALLGLTS